MITRLGHTTLFVLDQKKAYDVYVHVLGFQVKTDMTMENGFRWLTVTAPQDPHLEIVLAEPNAPMVDEEEGVLIRRLLEKNALGAGVLECDDIDGTYKTLKAKGVHFLKEPTKEFYGTEALFRDGCGNWFSLTQRDSTPA